jgi:pimeloyl-ACP methyl ester carboxylesterase
LFLEIEMDKMMAEKGMVPAGAYRLAYTRMGAGSPVVVLEAAGGAPRSTWDTVMPAIAGFTRVISYDRPGLGESEWAGRRRNLTDLTGDLKSLLDGLDEPGPFILVGNSIGGHIIRYFAYQHPEQVAGLVFIDSNHPDLERRQRDLLPPPAPDESDYLKGMRAWLTQEYIENPNDWEGIDFFACAEQAREVRSFGDLPLVVISAGNHGLDEGDPGSEPGVLPPGFAAAFDQLWQDLQVDLTRLSTRGRQVIAHNSGHFVHQYEPDLVVSILREMVEAYRAGANGSGSHAGSF